MIGDAPVTQAGKSRRDDVNRPEASSGGPAESAAAAARTRTARPVALVVAVLLTTVSAVTTWALLVPGGELDPPAAAALPDPGAVTRWGLPAVRVVRDVAVSLTVGALMAVLVLLPTRGRGGQLSKPQLSMVQLAGWAALGWATASVLELVLTYSDLSAEPPATVGLTVLLQFVGSVDVGLALAVSAVMASGIAFGSMSVVRVGGVVVMAALAGVALWALATTGHAGGDANHDISVTTQFFHLLAATAWVGGLFAMFTLRSQDALDRAVLHRYSRLAGWAWAVLGVSGVVAAVLRVPTVAQLASGYGLLLGLKVLGLLMLGVIGFVHRRHSLSVRRSSARVFSRLAVGELVLMAATFGVAVALSRSEPPSNEITSADPVTAMIGFPMPPPLGAAEWFTQWRLDPMWGTAAIAMLVLYTIGVWRLRRRGDPGPGDALRRGRPAASPCCGRPAGRPASTARCCSACTWCST